MEVHWPLLHFQHFWAMLTSCAWPQNIAGALIHIALPTYWGHAHMLCMAPKLVVHWSLLHFQHFLAMLTCCAWPQNWRCIDPCCTSNIFWPCSLAVHGPKIGGALIPVALPTFFGHAHMLCMAPKLKVHWSLLHFQHFWAMLTCCAWPQNWRCIDPYCTSDMLGPCSLAVHGPKIGGALIPVALPTYWGHAHLLCMAPKLEVHWSLLHFQHFWAMLMCCAWPQNWWCIDPYCTSDILGPCSLAVHGPKIGGALIPVALPTFLGHAHLLCMAPKLEVHWSLLHFQHFWAMPTCCAWPQNWRCIDPCCTSNIFWPCSLAVHGSKIGGALIHIALPTFLGHAHLLCMAPKLVVHWSLLHFQHFLAMLTCCAWPQNWRCIDPCCTSNIFWPCSLAVHGPKIGGALIPVALPTFFGHAHMLCMAPKLEVHWSLLHFQHFWAMLTCYAWPQNWWCIDPCCTSNIFWPCSLAVHGSKIGGALTPVALPTFLGHAHLLCMAPKLEVHWSLLHFQHFWAMPTCCAWPQNWRCIDPCCTSNIFWPCSLAVHGSKIGGALIHIALPTFLGHAHLLCMAPKLVVHWSLLHFQHFWAMLMCCAWPQNWWCIDPYCTSDILGPCSLAVHGPKIGGALIPVALPTFLGHAHLLCMAPKLAVHWSLLHLQHFWAMLTCYAWPQNWRCIDPCCTSNIFWPCSLAVHGSKIGGALTPVALPTFLGHAHLLCMAPKLVVHWSILHFRHIGAMLTCCAWPQNWWCIDPCCTSNIFGPCSLAVHGPKIGGALIPVALPTFFGHAHLLCMAPKLEVHWSLLHFQHFLAMLTCCAWPQNWRCIDPCCTSNIFGPCSLAVQAPKLAVHWSILHFRHVGAMLTCCAWPQNWWCIDPCCTSDILGPCSLAVHGPKIGGALIPVALPTFLGHAHVLCMAPKLVVHWSILHFRHIGAMLTCCTWPQNWWCIYPCCTSNIFGPCSLAVHGPKIGGALIPVAFPTFFGHAHLLCMAPKLEVHWSLLHFQHFWAMPTCCAWPQNWRCIDPCCTSNIFWPCSLAVHGSKIGGALIHIALPTFLGHAHFLCMAPKLEVHWSLLHFQHFGAMLTCCAWPQNWRCIDPCCTSNIFWPCSLAVHGCKKWRCIDPCCTSNIFGPCSLAVHGPKIGGALIHIALPTYWGHAHMLCMVPKLVVHWSLLHFQHFLAMLTCCAWPQNWRCIDPCCTSNIFWPCSLAVHGPKIGGALIPVALPTFFGHAHMLCMAPKLEVHWSLLHFQHFWAMLTCCAWPQNWRCIDPYCTSDMLGPCSLAVHGPKIGGALIPVALPTFLGHAHVLCMAPKLVVHWSILHFRHIGAMLTCCAWPQNWWCIDPCCTSNIFGPCSLAVHGPKIGGALIPVALPTFLGHAHLLCMAPKLAVHWSLLHFQHFLAMLTCCAWLQNWRCIDPYCTSNIFGPCSLAMHGPKIGGALIPVALPTFLGHAHLLCMAPKLAVHWSLLHF